MSFNINPNIPVNFGVPPDVNFLNNNPNPIIQYKTDNEYCLFEGVSASVSAGASSSVGVDIATSLASVVSIPSLIHKLFETHGIEVQNENIENTKNGIWLKANTYSWPFKKPIHQLKFIELLSYITQYSIRDFTEKASEAKKIDARFCLWCDVSGTWYFKSVGKLIEESEEEEEVFYVNPESEHLSNKIYNIRTISHSKNLINNIENNIFYSSYVRIDPDYKDPYIDFVDTQSSKIGSSGLDKDELKKYLKYDYDKEFPNINHIGDTPINFLFDLDVDAFGGASGPTGDFNVTVWDTDNTKYGYFNETRYNTPNPVWWETIGSYRLDTDYTSKWQTQYDITDNMFETFHEIYTRVKVPLIKNRKKFNRLMNLKRKWEAYRCTVCCLNQPIGSSKDIIMFEESLADKTGKTFAMIYGEDGVFSNTGILKKHKNAKNVEPSKYGIVAAGSFTDLINFGVSGIIGITADENGLYMSRDLATDPYKQTIGEFYNLSGGITNSFIDSIVTKAKKDYTDTILHNKKRINQISTFLSKADDWIIAGISFINDNTINCEECNESISRESILKTVNNYWSLSTEFNNNNTTGFFNGSFNYLKPDGFTGATWDMPFDDGSYSKGIPCGFKERYAGPNIPVTSFFGPTGPGLTYTYDGPYLKVEGISAKIPYIELGRNCCLRTINFGNTYGGGEKLTGITGPVRKFSYIPKFQYLPAWCQDCSANVFIRGKDNLFFEGATGPFGSTASDDYFNQQSRWGISERYGAIPGISGATSGNHENTPRVSYNENCFNPNILIALKQQAKLEYNALLVETFLLDKIIKLDLMTGTRQSLKQQYNEWKKRPAFFYSKTPGSSIFYKGITAGQEWKGGGIQLQGTGGNIGEGNTRFRKKQLKQQLSLKGIKSITRKDIRGSRYEILAKSQGISGASFNNWLYNIAWGADNPGPENYDFNNGPVDLLATCETTSNHPILPALRLHPYYDQRFIGGTHEAIGASGSTGPPKGATGAYFDNSILLDITKQYIGVTYAGHSGDYLVKIPMMLVLPLPVGVSGASGDPKPSGIFDIKQTSIPSNLKRESIASYVRIEFTVPIGLDRIADFPDGFVRNAGCEYFLPYIISLTVGPTGRQTVRNNVAVIGMDPYGFDVAVKKMKVESRYDFKNNWWWEGGNPEITQTDLTTNGMDLWPEFMFETEFPYYAANPYGFENLVTDDEKWNKTEHKWKRSAEFDPERRKTAMGSGYLMSSHRKIKPHRSWWSCYIPQNLFIPQKLHSMINEITSNFSGEICNFYRPGYIHTRSIQGDDFDGWFTGVSGGVQHQTTLKPFLENSNFGFIQ